MLFMHCRFGSYRTTNAEHFFYIYGKLDSQFLFYIVSMTTQIRKSFYDIYKHARSTPLFFKVFPTFIGKSSIAIAVEMYNAGTKDLYASNVIQFVSVERSSRKPTALPDSLRDKFASRCTGSSLVISPQKQPDSVNSAVPSHSTEHKISHMDIDRNNHTNFASYIKYAIETAMEGSRLGIFSGIFSGPLWHYRTKTIMASFIGDSRVGDVVLVAAWQDSSDSLKLHFNVTLKQKPICQLSVEFYENFVTATL